MWITIIVGTSTKKFCIITFFQPPSILEGSYDNCSLKFRSFLAGENNAHSRMHLRKLRFLHLRLQRNSLLCSERDDGVLVNLRVSRIKCDTLRIETYGVGNLYLFLSFGKIIIKCH